MCIRLVFVMPRVRALLTGHDFLFKLVGHPRDERTRVGTRNSGMDVEPDTLMRRAKLVSLAGLEVE